MEVFGTKARLKVKAAYWLIPMPSAVLRPELQAFLAWLREQAAQTREADGRGPSQKGARAPKPRVMRSRRSIDA